MATDFRNFNLTAKANSTQTVAVVTCSVLVVDSETGATIGDFTGANSFDFFLFVPGFSVADHRELAGRIAQFMIRRKLGLE